MDEKRENTSLNIYLVIFLMCLGVMARFGVMCLGHNFDFESYEVVGEIVARGDNVYAETTRYNYGFIFSLIQGLGYKLTSYLENSESAYRAYITTLITMTDIGIALWIMKRYSKKAAILFFLNPISIVITGYHNQFDNMAVLAALISIDYYDENDALTKKDIISIICLTISLITKHILYLFWGWILFNQAPKNRIKKMVYVCAPPILFVFSFIPFMLEKNARCGIVNNVFLYRSYNNFPLLSPILNMLSIPENCFFLIYVALVLVLGVIVRKKNYEEIVLIYFAAMVAFSSAIANQYLIIPMTTLAVCRKKFFYWAYTVSGSIYILFNGNGLHLGYLIKDKFPACEEWIKKVTETGGCIITWMMLVLVMYILWQIRYDKKNCNTI